MTLLLFIFRCHNRVCSGLDITMAIIGSSQRCHSYNRFHQQFLPSRVANMVDVSRSNRTEPAVSKEITWWWLRCWRRTSRTHWFHKTHKHQPETICKGDSSSCVSSFSHQTLLHPFIVLSHLSVLRSQSGHILCSWNIPGKLFTVGNDKEFKYTNVLKKIV